jgi:hypothetical protein
MSGVGGMLWKGLITILACDLVLAVLAIPLALRKVPRNAVYGFRTPTTLGDEVVWRETNAHFGRGFFAASLVSAAAIGGLFFFGENLGAAFLPASVAVLVLPPLVAALASWRYSRQIARARGSRDR